MIVLESYEKKERTPNPNRIGKRFSKRRRILSWLTRFILLRILDESGEHITRLSNVERFQKSHLGFALGQDKGKQIPVDGTEEGDQHAGLLGRSRLAPALKTWDSVLKHRGFCFCAESKECIESVFSWLRADWLFYSQIWLFDYFFWRANFLIWLCAINLAIFILRTGYKMAKEIGENWKKKAWKILQNLIAKF